MKQVFSGINYCHINKIVHRDLKPENILLTKRDIKGILDYQVKIIDFGNSIKNNKNVFKNIVGTPFYVAPEALTSNINSKCDLWSLGVIMYILLYGVPPFGGNTDDEIIENVISGKFFFPDEIRRHSSSKSCNKNKVSPEAKDLIRKLINKNVEERYSAQQALDHPWLANFDEDELIYGKGVKGRLMSKQSLLKDFQDENLANLKSFCVSQKFQQISLGILMHQFQNDEETKKLRKIFEEFDTDHDGHLTRDELLEGLSKVMDKEDAEKETDQLMQALDTDGSGFIEFEEFLRASANKENYVQKDKLKVIYDLLDENKDGQISIKEMKNFFKDDEDFNVGDETWREFIGEVDTDDDGQLSFNEFEKLMKDLIVNKDKKKK